MKRKKNVVRGSTVIADVHTSILPIVFVGIFMPSTIACRMVRIFVQLY